MQVLKEILETLPDGQVREVRIGLHWTAVVAELEGELRCGLAASLSGAHDHHKEPDVPQAGQLESLPARQLAEWSLGAHPVRTSIGMAAVNALLPRYPERWSDENAEQVIANLGAGKRVALIGDFPFVPSLRQQVGELIVLEQNPGPDDLPAEAAPQVLPGADVVAITGMTLVNHTLEGLLALCSPQAKVLVLGPSTPLSPVLFDHGVDVLSGSIVTNIPAVLRILSQGGNFRQVHRGGVRLVNMSR